MVVLESLSLKGLENFIKTSDIKFEREFTICLSGSCRSAATGLSASVQPIISSTTWILARVVDVQILVVGCILLVMITHHDRELPCYVHNYR